MCDDVGCVSLTYSWVPRHRRHEDSPAASCFCVNTITCRAFFHLSVVPALYIWSGAVRSG